MLARHAEVEGSRHGHGFAVSARNDSSASEADRRSFRRRRIPSASRLKIATQHVCRDLEMHREAPRPGNSNPDLAAIALRMALEEARLEAGELAYLIGHTTSPACLVLPNIPLVSDRVGFAGPYMELRQACTGFANALVIAQGLVSRPGVKAVAIVGSETGSVYFDPQRAGEDVSQLVNLVMMGDGACSDHRRSR